MTTATQITKFLGSDVFASRPAAATASALIPTGGIGLWGATDTGALYWIESGGSAWRLVSGTGPVAPTYVQSKCASIAGAVTVTMGSAPTNGNLLIGIWFGNGFAISGSSLASGWILMTPPTGSGSDNWAAAYKWAGAGESTTQTPYGASVTGAVVVFEFSGARGAHIADGIRNQTGTAIAGSHISKKDAVAFCGAFETVGATTLPTSITNATALTTASSGTRAIAPYQGTIATASTLAVTANYGSSVTVNDAWVMVV